MCARFTVLSDEPIAAAIAGCVIPLSRNSTIWMRWRCAAGIFHRSAVFSRRTSALLHLAICFPRIRWCKRITPWQRKTASQPAAALNLRQISIQTVMEVVLGEGPLNDERDKIGIAFSILIRALGDSGLTREKIENAKSVIEDWMKLLEGATPRS